MVAPAAPPPRIVLRPFDTAEARDVLDGRRRPNWSRGYPTEGDHDIARLVFERPPVPGELPLWGPHQIVHASSGTVIGGIGCHRPPDEHGTIEIGYGVAPEWRNQGLTTEAVRTLVRAVAEAGASEIVARTRPDNVPSQAVLRHNEFTQVGLGTDGLLIWHRPAALEPS